MFRSPQKSLIALFFSHANALVLFFFAPLYIFLCLLEFFNATEVPLMLNFEFGSDIFLSVKILMLECQLFEVKVKN